MPPKTCTFDCIYCQLGRTAKKVSKPEELKTTVTVEKIMEDLEKTLESTPLESIDHVTFSGSGEPTLNLQLGEMIDHVKNIVGSSKPVVVLTNASLVCRKDVRANLAEADLVIAKLDAPTQHLFESINRPAENLKLTSVVKGLRALRRETFGRLALQMMFLKSATDKNTNHQYATVKRLAEIASSIDPDEVQINTPTRPPSREDVTPLHLSEIKEISRIMTEVLPRVRILAKGNHGQMKERKKKDSVLETEILGLLKRRPCRLVDLAEAFGVNEGNVKFYINKLVASGGVTSVRLHGEIYYETVR
ncbi:radical SAM protein [Candidatus Hecatella orcuttiae]|uniref:radical SAM protein n=1 Tax=Candidatus Hecatella orcuttiae TaxID=1935119 RepID=UPI0028681B3F|nr:radical SAM protein [Candidatus Hecatella orcuttiae]